MKQETKELVDWIKKQINIAKTNNIDPAWNGRHEAYNADYDRAMAFLDSLPEIESHLCKGGYIQDKNGTPCCDGDRVRFKFVESWYLLNFKDRYTPVMEGKLEFSVETKSFIIIFGPDHNGYDWLDWTDADSGREWFEKV
jgi:hypothetical protein